jgi:hypothetical protein
VSVWNFITAEQLIREQSSDDCDRPPSGWTCSRGKGHDGPCAATPDEDRLREAEAHLWALVVWFGGPHENPYVQRDLNAAAAYVDRHLAGEDMTARHREVMDRG